MFKNSLKKLCAFACAAAMVAQFAVFVPVAGAEPISKPVIGEQKINPTDAGVDATTNEVSSKSTNSVTKNAAISPELKGAFDISFDMTINTPLKEGNTTSRATKDSFFIEFNNSGKDGVGSAFMAKHSDLTANTVTFCWKANKDDPGRFNNDSDGSEFTFQIGQKYHLVFQFTKVGSSKEEGEGSATLLIQDENGTTLSTTPNLYLRQISEKGKSINQLQIQMVARENGTTDSVKIENMSAIVTKVDGISATIGGKNASASTPTVLKSDGLEDISADVTVTATAAGTATTAYTVIKNLVSADGSALPEGVTFTDNKIKVSKDAPGTYNLKLVTYIQDMEEDSTVEFPITVEMAEVTDAQRVQIISNSVTLVDKKTSQQIVAVDGKYPVSDDLIFATGTETIKVSWQAMQSTDGTTWTESNIISTSGVVMPEDTDNQIKLVATVKHVNYVDEETTPGLQVTKEYPLQVVQPKNIIEPIKEAITFVKADKISETYDPTTVLNEDIKLQTKDVSTNPSPYVKIAWTSSNENNLKIKNGVAEVYLSNTNTYTSDLTATVTYEKNGKVLGTTTKVYPITIKVDMDNVAPKYAVRFDSATKADIPDSTTTDLTLRKKGNFGSVITWTSSQPRVISTTGKVTRPATQDATVTLTETLTSGTYSATNTYTVKVPAKKSGGGSGSGSGSSGSDDDDYNQQWTGSVVNPNPTPTPSVKPSEAPFTDISNVAWAKDAINTLYTRNAIKGKTATEFAPNDNVTRAEFAQILVNALGLTTKQGALNPVTAFSDVNTSDWYYTAVAAAYNTGVIKGMGDGTFGVNEKITRQDMAVMIDRAAKAANRNLQSVNAQINFADGASIADYAKDSVTTLQKAGIINGISETEFAPTQTATRAQAAQMVYGLIK